MSINNAVNDKVPGLKIRRSRLGIIFWSRNILPVTQLVTVAPGRITTILIVNTNTYGPNTFMLIE